MGRKSKRQERERAALRAELEKSLEETKVMMAQAYLGFNAAADSELVESYIYEIQALRSRYSDLLRQRKALEEQTEPVALPQRKRQKQALPAPQPTGQSALPVA